MAGRYLPTELSNKDGDIVYPHSDASIIWMEDGKSVQQALNDAVTEDDIKDIFNS